MLIQELPFTPDFMTFQADTHEPGRHVMKRELLRTHLHDLEQDLSKVNSPLPEDRQRLSDISQEARTLLDKADTLSEQEHRAFLESLRLAIDHFEGRHPELTVRLSLAINLLAEAGL
jgi:hypothetical protein